MDSGNVNKTSYQCVWISMMQSVLNIIWEEKKKYLESTWVGERCEHSFTVIIYHEKRCWNVKRLKYCKNKNQIIYGNKVFTYLI